MKKETLATGLTQESGRKQNRPEHELNWEAVDRLDWHLWVLASFLIFVLGISLLTFMFPSVFWAGKEPVQDGSQRAFFGFCVLLSLVLVYLLQRQATIRRLKRQVYSAQAALAAAEQEATAQLFLNLPGTGQFRDTLAMEYRRATSTGMHLAAILFKAPRASLEALGQMTQRVRPTLRQGESLFRISDKALAVVLPNMRSTDARSFATQLASHSGFPPDNLDVTVTCFPEEVASLAALDYGLRAQ